MQASVRKQAFLHSRKYLLAHGRVGETPLSPIKPDGVADMATVGYVCIGTNDFDRATAFYDALLGEFGGKRMMPTPQGLIYKIRSEARRGGKEVYSTLRTRWWTNPKNKKQKHHK